MQALLVDKVRLAEVVVLMVEQDRLVIHAVGDAATVEQAEEALMVAAPMAEQAVMAECQVAEVVALEVPILEVPEARVVEAKSESLVGR
jgi:hypothetical protein